MTTHTDGSEPPITPDQEAALAPTVTEVYGPKYNVIFSDRDARIAFGSAYTGRDGKVVYAYKVLVAMPLQTARELHMSLGAAIKALDEAGKLPLRP